MLKNIAGSREGFSGAKLFKGNKDDRNKKSSKLGNSRNKK